MKSKAYQFLDAKRDEMIQILRALIRHKSVAVLTEGSHPSGDAVQAVLDEALIFAREFGLSCVDLDGYAGLIDLPGTDGNCPIGILCHLDVVPEGDGWTFPPYEGVVRDGKLYGRGATDNKGPFVSALFALAALREIGAPLSRGVRLIAGTSEEKGSPEML